MRTFSANAMLYDFNFTLFFAPLMNKKLSLSENILKTYKLELESGESSMCMHTKV
jgi:hypothetical protein